MNKLIGVLAAIACVIMLPAAAPKGEKVTASNGQIVTIFRDSFKAQAEYSLPRIEMRDGWYNFTLRRSTKTGDSSYLIDGVIKYRTPWRFYTIAMLPGADEASITTLRKEVGRCSAFTMQCIVGEQYQVEVTKAQFDTALEAGKLEVQLSSATGNPFVITIPKEQLEGAREVATKEAAQP